MAIFSKKEKKDTEKKVEQQKHDGSVVKKTAKNVLSKNNARTERYSVLIRPRITEKASDVTAGSVYVFDVMPNATKKEIKEAFIDKFKTIPRKIAVVNLKRKKRFIRGKKGLTSGGKKAYIYLEKGNSIEVI